MNIKKRKRLVSRHRSLEKKAWEWAMRTIRGRKVELVIFSSSPIAGMLARLAARHDVPYRIEAIDPSMDADLTIPSSS